MANNSKCSCVICKSEVTVSALGNHYNSKTCKSGGKHIPKGVCPYCNIHYSEIDCDPGNHTRWCDKNPNSRKYRRELGERTKNRQPTPEERLRAAKSISKAHKDGRYKNAPTKAIATKLANGTNTFSPEAYKIVCEANRKASHQRVCKRTHIFIDKNDREFKFDSSWEDALAIRLDELNIAWDRPKPIKYLAEDGKERNYFPDFYLPEFDLYLDPKNLFVEKQQKYKLDVVSKQINLIILHSIEECKNWHPRQESNLHKTD